MKIKWTAKNNHRPFLSNGRIMSRCLYDSYSSNFLTFENENWKDVFQAFPAARNWKRLMLKLDYFEELNKFFNRDPLEDVNRQNVFQNTQPRRSVKHDTGLSKVVACFVSLITWTVWNNTRNSWTMKQSTLFQLENQFEWPHKLGKKTLKHIAKNLSVFFSKTYIVHIVPTCRESGQRTAPLWTGQAVPQVAPPVLEKVATAFRC